MTENVIFCPQTNESRGWSRGFRYLPTPDKDTWQTARRRILSACARLVKVSVRTLTMPLRDPLKQCGDEAVCIFLAAVGSTLRVCQQVPSREYSPEIFLQVLEGTLDWRNVPQPMADRVRANQSELGAMMSVLRKIHADPTLTLLDPSDSPAH